MKKINNEMNGVRISLFAYDRFRDKINHIVQITTKWISGANPANIETIRYIDPSTIVEIDTARIEKKRRVK
jgi:hypothetical protein